MTTAAFTKSLAVNPQFRGAFEDDGYVPVPDDWLIACTDVVGSRKAIEAGKYKAVNMAGVAMISAVMNALGHQDVPYIFGGDGAAMIFAPQDRETVFQALAATMTWVSEDLELELRAAIVPVSDMRQENADVLVKAIRVSDAMHNYAFSGGGISLAEKAMKDGRFVVEAAKPGTRPDLEGLSCRWTPIKHDNKKIVSVILEPGSSPDVSFSKMAIEAIERCGLVAVAPERFGGGNPMPQRGPGFTWPPEGLEYEARASRGDKDLGKQRRLLKMVTFLAWVLDKTGVPIGGFSPKRYREYTALNTDYRKFQDGLRMTVSMTDDQFQGFETWLEGERSEGNLRYGLCVQDSAVLTCFVPSIMDDNHFHFLDGAGGGYAQAATNMKG